MRAAFSAKCGAGYRRHAWREMAHLPPAEYSAEVFGKILCHRMACDVIRSVRSYPAEYYFAAEQASGSEPGTSNLQTGAHGSSEGHEMLKRNDKYH